jgi:D-alanine-D-alanine ligase
MTNDMRIGLTYDLRTDEPGNGRAGLPDDLQEEFDSPATIEAIAAALRGLGHDVVKLGDGRELLERLLADPPEFVFNIAEGQGVSRSREARVPAVLELLGIPYSGSDPLTLAATLDKDCAKRLVASAGAAVPRGFVLGPADPVGPSSLAGHNFPLLVKPAWEGSSKGIRGKCLVRSPEELAEVVASLRRDHRQPILVEEFIDGDELTVGVVGNDPPEIVGVLRVLPNRTDTPFIYSLEVKRDFRRQVRYECPAALPAEATAAVERAALAAYRVLGCRDVSRVDFRLRGGVPYFLEVNPLPGLNPETSDLVILAGLAGCPYERLIARILEAALSRIEDRGSRIERRGSVQT